MALITPAMTDFTAPSGYVVSSSGDYSSSYLAWYAFRQDGTTSVWISQNSAITDEAPAWLQIQLPEAATARSFKFTPRNHSNWNPPQDFKLQGSNNGIDWTDLKSVTGFNGTYNSNSPLYILDTYSAFTYYRLRVSARYLATTNVWCAVGELSIYDDIPAFEPVEVTAPKAQWRMESGTLTTDSVGGNTLTNNNTVVEDDVDYTEGGCSAVFTRANNEWLSIVDANLDTGFPFKSGSSSNLLTVFCRFKITSIANEQKTLFAKYYAAGNARSFNIESYDTYLRFTYGYNSGVSSSVGADVNGIAADRWYSVCFKLNEATKTRGFVVWDEVTGCVISDVSTAFSNAISVTSAPFTIGNIADAGSTWAYDGNIDDVRVFDYILTNDQAETVRLDVGSPPAIITLPATAVSPTFSSPALTGIREGVYTQTDTLVSPTFSPAGLDIVQIGSFTLPETSVSPTFALADLLGLQEGLLGFSGFTAAPTLATASLLGIHYGYFIMRSTVASPQFGSPALTGFTIDFPPPPPPEEQEDRAMSWSSVPQAPAGNSVMWSSVPSGNYRTVNWNTVPTR